MQSILHATAALSWSAAVLFLAITGVTHAVNASELARRFGGFTAGAVFLGLGLECLAGFVTRIEVPSIERHGGGSSDASWICVAAVAGHVVLAIALAARHFGSRFAEAREEEQRRGRLRERVSAELRRDEVAS